MKKAQRSRKPSTLWFLPDESAEQRETITKELHNNSNNHLLKRMRGVVLSRLESLENSERAEDYMAPSWANLQAHRNGRKQEMYFLFALLSFLEDDEHVTKYRKGITHD